MLTLSLLSSLLVLVVVADMSVDGVGLLLSLETMSWYQAEQYCREVNASLIILDNVEKWYSLASSDFFVRNVIDEKIWINMKFNDTIPCVEHPRGLVWMFSGWGRWSGDGEPNNCRREACIRLEQTYMFTTKCSFMMKALCEKRESEASNDPKTTTNDYTAGVSSAISSPSAGPSNPDTMTAVSSSTVQSTTSAMQTTARDVETDRSSIGVTVTTNSIICDLPRNQSCHLNQQERDKMKHLLKILLLINKTSLSAHKRKLISVYDSRPSSVAMGGVAVTVLVGLVGLIVLPDIIYLCRYLYKRKLGIE